MIIFAFIATAAALLAVLALVTVVVGIRATERRQALRRPGYGRTDIFTRCLLGVYADCPRSERENAESNRARR
jgi:hypothetical protein